MRIWRFKNEKLREWLEIAAEVFVIIFIMYLVCWPYAIDGDSMLPGLRSNDRVIMSRLLVMTNNFDKNDIIVCKITRNGQTRNIIKRLIAAPGDTVVINGGDVFVNGELLDEQYVDGQKTFGDIDIRLQEDEYFILGDNRSLSVDSRDFGPIKRKDITGKIFFKFPLFFNKKY